MAMLSSSRRRDRASDRARSDEDVVSIIARDLHVEGTLSGGGVIRVEGTVVGTIRAEHVVLVAKGGTVEGDIHTQEAILGGEVNGSIVADARVEVQASAVIHGDITTPCLVVNDGAALDGNVHMDKPKETRDPGPGKQHPNGGMGQARGVHTVE
jgi:cytoskeletal protein CcmA (bactofilin family)